VVGEQPILHPGQTYEYQSACPLFTTFGTMEGEYEMVLIDEHGERVTSQDRKVVEIGRFALIKPETA
jgi:ApaG protein